MKSVLRSLILAFLSLAALSPNTAQAVSETDFPGHSLYLHIKGWATPFPGPGNYTIDFTPAGHGYSITATDAVTAASGNWSFRQGDIGGSIVLSLENYFGNGTGAEIVLLPNGYYELYAGNSNQNGNWSLVHFVQDPIFDSDLPDLTGPENGYVSFVPSLLNGITGVAFQWFKDGVPLSGANKATLLLLSLDKSMEGIYSVQVSNGSDTNLSRAARLTVVPPVTATFNGQAFAMIMTNNAPPPGLPPTDAANAFRLKAPSQAAWADGELTFLAEYSGSGTNKSKSGVGIFAVSNGVPRKLILSTEIMPGTQSPYLSIAGFSEPVEGKFLFNAVAKSPAGVLDYAVLEWSGSASIPLVASKTAIPGNQSVQFQYFGVPGGPGLDAAFAGFGPGTTAGFYAFENGNLIRLFDNNTVLPGFPAPPLNIDAGIVPSGDSQTRLLSLRERINANVGVFLRTADGAFKSLVDSNTVYPGTAERMTQIGAVVPKQLQDLTAFVLGDATGQSYLISADAQGLHAVAKAGDPLPDGRASFRSINTVGITDAGIVFSAVATDGNTGVYLSQSGQIKTVVDTLSLVGTNIVTAVSLRDTTRTNLLLTMTLYPAGVIGLAANIDTAPVAPLNLRITGSRINPDIHFAVTVSGQSGTVAVLEHSFNLSNWEPVETNIFSSAELTITDPRLWPRQISGFYRIKSAQP